MEGRIIIKKKLVILIAALLLLPVFAGCSASVAQTAVSETAQAIVESVSPVSTQGLQQMAAITLNGGSASAEGGGVTVDGSTVTIIAGGTYTLTGTFTDGRIVVDAGKDEIVELVLNGVSVASSTGAAIYCKQADTTVVTLAEGTENTLTGASNAGDSDAATDEPDAALFAEDGLAIRGEGALTVTGSMQSGIVAKDALVIESGTIAVQADNHGIRGKDSVKILDGGITIDAGNDGIQSDNTGDAAKGYVLIAGGTLQITAAHDGIQAQTSLKVSGGILGIQSGGGYTTESYSAEESYKGLKSAGTVSVTGGEITVNSLDDAIHAGDTVTVSGGSLMLTTRDDGIHAEGTVHITGGTVAIAICYEGIEGTVVNIEGGTISMLAADDGINAADASAGGQGDRMGRFGGFGDTADSSLQVTISGGTIFINAYGDGVDSNGYITMTGGALYVSGPVSSRNGAIDYNGTFLMTGGTLAAAGASGMAQAPSQGSAQPSVIVYFTQTQAAGATCWLTDESGNAILSYTPDKEFQCIVFSSPELTVGSGYRVYVGSGEDLESAALLEAFTQSGTVTSVGGGAAQTWNTQQDFGPQRNDMRRP